METAEIIKPYKKVLINKAKLSEIKKSLVLLRDKIVNQIYFKYLIFGHKVLLGKKIFLILNNFFLYHYTKLFVKRRLIKSKNGHNHPALFSGFSSNATCL